MNDPVLVTMAGPGRKPLDIGQMSNFEAGIATLAMIDAVYPGIRWKELPGLAVGVRPETMGWNPFRSIYKAAGEIKDGIGGTLKDAFDYIGGAGGDAVRLVTDEKVIDGATRLGTAYASGGLIGGEGGGPLDTVMKFISGLGASAKQAFPSNQAGMFGGGNALPWVLGGGVVIALLVGRRK
jgi:hypothetical protein